MADGQPEHIMPSLTLLAGKGVKIVEAWMRIKSKEI